MRVVEFSCFCPVALAGLAGALPETIRSRSIRIPMRRRAADETVRPFRERTTRPEGEALRRRLEAWVKRHGDEVPEAPDLPDGVADRQADQWEPLIALADAAGGHWPETARAACVAIVTEARSNVDDQSLGIRADRWPVSRRRHADLNMVDLLRLRRWRRRQRQVSRFPDDPPDLFLEAEFGIDRDR